MHQEPPDFATPRRAARRWRTWTGTSVAAVVVAGGAALATASGGDEAPAQPVAVSQWPARGPLAGGTALIGRAKLAWANASPAGTPGSEAAVLYAGPLGGQNATLVVLRPQRRRR